MKPNPPWLTDLVGDFWHSLEGKVPPEWFPKISDVRGGRGGKLVGELKELGCGNYGCVLPTQSPDVVLKATTDQSEIEYAAHLAHAVPVDVTAEYFMVVGLNSKIDKRPVALLWREAADHVGEIQRAIPRGKKAVALIVAQHRCASRILLGHSKGLTATVMQPFIAGWLDSLDAMAEIAELQFVALGMKQCFAEQGVMFLDVHEGNLGRVLRAGTHRWVITDPGNVVRLEQRTHREGPPRAAVARRRNPAPSWAKSEDEIAAFEYEQAVRESLMTHAPAGIRAGIGEDDVFAAMSPTFNKLWESEAGRHHLILSGSPLPTMVVLRANPYTEAWKDQTIHAPPSWQLSRTAARLPPRYEPGPEIAHLLDEVCEDLNEHWRAGARGDRKWVWDTLFAMHVGYFVFKIDFQIGRKRNISNPDVPWCVTSDLVPPVEKWFLEGTLVRTRRVIDRFPEFSVAAGETGVVTDSNWDDDRPYASVRIAENVPGAEDWDNQVIWMADQAEHHELGTDQQNVAAEIRQDLEPAIFKPY